MTAFSLGPFVFDRSIFILLVAVLAAVLCAVIVERRYTVRVERHIWPALILALLAARGVFVAEYWSLYQENWASIIDVRDGGFNATAGMLMLVVYSAWRVWRLQAGARPAYLTTVIVALGIWLGGQWLIPTPNGKALPDDISLVALSEKGAYPIQLTHYTGKPTVINLWATWCPPCQREMPVLEAAQQRYDDVNFVFVNQQEAVETIDNYVQKEQLQLRNMLLDQHGEMLAFTNSKGLPTTLFIDENGWVQDIRMGEVSAATLEAKLQGIRQPRTAP